MPLPRTLVERASVAVTAVCAVLIALLLADGTHAATGATAWVGRPAGSRGTWSMLSVYDQRWPKVLSVVVAPPYRVTVDRMPQTGDGGDRYAQAARRDARAAGDVVATAWTLARHRAHRPVRVAGMGDMSGPSAGLVLALDGADGAVAEDLTGGVDVAATGAVDRYGQVGEVGLVARKADAAAKARARVLFVPAGNRGELAGDPRWSVQYVVGEERDFADPGRGQRYRDAGTAAQVWPWAGGVPAVPVRHTADVLDWLCGYTGRDALCDTADETRAVAAARRAADERATAEATRRRRLAAAGVEAGRWLEDHAGGR